MHSTVNQAEPLQECRDSFLVCALQYDGRGDIYGAHEIALRIQKLMPHAKVVFTVLQPRFNDIEKYLFSTKVFVTIAQIQQQESWEIEPETNVLKMIDTFKRIIIFPAYHDSLLPSEILKYNEIVIKLREYGVGNPKQGIVMGPTYTLGLAKEKGEKGVLLPMEFSEKLPVHTDDPLQRLSHLQKVHPALSKAILGKDYSFESVQQFHASSKLYLGYFSQDEVFFCYINALLKFNKINKENLIICNTQNRPPDLLENIKETLWRTRFGAVKIIEFADYENYKEENFKFKGDKNKKICTILFRPLSGLEMDALLDATEDESLTTGDNSPLRFMAHRKTIAYDTREQKEGYAEAIIDLAGKFDPRLKKLLPFAFFGALKSGEEVNVIALEDGMVAFFNAMKTDLSLKENWYQFIDEIFAKYDFTPELEKILLERMPEFKKCS